MSLMVKVEAVAFSVPKTVPSIISSEKLLFLREVWVPFNIDDVPFTIEFSLLAYELMPFMVDEGTYMGMAFSLPELLFPFIVGGG